MTSYANCPNEAWILHREDFDTAKDGHCNGYVLLDAFTGHCFGVRMSKDLPTLEELNDLLLEAKNTAKVLPKKILIKKKDPSLETLDELTKIYQVEVLALTQKELNPLTKDFRNSMKSFKRNEEAAEFSIINDNQEEELELFTPSPYDPCPCASGKKFKFCCYKAFREIIFSMVAAQEGKLEEALFHINEAEAQVGRTAEIVTRLAILWSFFDKNKSEMYLNEALQLNANHPRLNYLLGIEAVQAKKYAEAVSFYQKAIENYPKEDRYHLNETYNNLANAFYYLNKYQGAKDAWEKALTYFPSDDVCKRNLLDFIYNNPQVPREIRVLSPFMKHFFKN